MLKLATLIQFVFLFTLSIAAFCQVNEFEKLGLEQGLSNNVVMDIFQDSKGFIWFATLDGLNRYDGYSITVFSHLPNDSNSISDSYATRLFEDSFGNFWVGTNNGLNRFIPAKNGFESFLNSSKSRNSISGNKIFSLAQDGAGNVWVGTDGAGLNCIREKYLQPKSGNVVFEHHNINNNDNSIVSNTIWDILFTDSLEAWLATKAGISRMQISGVNTEKLKLHFDNFSHNPDDPGSLSKMEIFRLLKDGKNIWVASYQGCLDKITPRNLNQSASIDIIKYGPKLNTLMQQNRLPVYSMLIDKKGILWVGTGTTGIISFDKYPHPDNLDAKGLNHYYNIPSITNSLPNDIVYSLFQDNSGIIWVGTDDGVAKYLPQKEKFNLENIQTYLRENFKPMAVASIFEMGDSILWVGTTREGLFAFIRQGKEFYQFVNDRTKPASISYNSISCIIKGRNGDLWIGTENGVNRIKGSEISVSRIRKGNISFEHYHRANVPDDKMKSPVILSLCESDDGWIWIGTGKGLSAFSPAENKWNVYQYSDSDDASISSNIVLSLFAESNRELWVGTDDGLNMLNRMDGTFTRYKNIAGNSSSLSNNRINCIAPFNKDTLLIGTHGGGINIFDKKNRSFTYLSVTDGLPNNVVNAIITDHSRNIWITTNKGVCRLNLYAKTFDNYDSKDGLYSNQCMGNAAFINSSGRIFIGSTSGLNVFSPDDISKNNFIPPVWITDIKIGDKSIFEDEFPEVRDSYFERKLIELPYFRNQISFEFAALNYVNTGKNQYQYKLDGYDDKWVHSKNFRFASYTNLAPGKYAFSVIGSNNDGIWNMKGETVSFYIMPPWYKTWWFKITAASILASLIYLITYMRIRTIQEQKQKELIRHAAAMKERFLANMSHEIRTPMNAIVGITRLLIDKTPRDDQKKYLNAIRQSSDNLLVIINDILDFSKIEAGKMELELIPFSIEKLLESVLQTMSLKAQEKNLEFTVNTEPGIPPAVIGDPVRLSEILINLTGNSIKFTPKGSVRILCRNLGNYTDANGNANTGMYNIQFKVTDTGIGIPEDKIEKIFESFSQATSETSRKFGGTGLGLTISKHLVELHGGKITVSSKPGSGSVFSFVIPFKITLASVLDDAAHRKAEALPQLSHLKILLAEDNEFNQLVAIDTLHSYIPGITVDVAGNGLAAFEKVRSDHYDVVLMDVQMPEMDGYTATRKIRKELQEPKNKIRIIAMTAAALKTEQQNCIDAGMDDYISKPFDPDLLVSKLNHFFATRETT